jgi:hypothetical protein
VRLGDAVSLYCNSDDTVISSANSAEWAKGDRNLFKPISFNLRRVEWFLSRQEKVLLLILGTGKP